MDGKGCSKIIIILLLRGRDVGEKYNSESLSESKNEVDQTDKALTYNDIKKAVASSYTPGTQRTRNPDLWSV